jgi:hypothetical protein
LEQKNKRPVYSASEIRAMTFQIRKEKRKLSFSRNCQRYTKSHPSVCASQQPQKKKKKKKKKKKEKRETASFNLMSLGDDPSRESSVGSDLFPDEFYGGFARSPIPRSSLPRRERLPPEGRFSLPPILRELPRATFPLDFGASRISHLLDRGLPRARTAISESDLSSSFCGMSAHSGIYSEISDFDRSSFNLVGMAWVNDTVFKADKFRFARLFGIRRNRGSTNRGAFHRAGLVKWRFQRREKKKNNAARRGGGRRNPLEHETGGFCRGTNVQIE